MVSSPAVALASAAPGTRALALVRGAHYLDHASSLQTWYKRAPYISYPALMLAQAGLDAKNSTPEERGTVLKKDALIMGTTLAATLWATSHLMKPEVSALPLTKAAATYAKTYYPAVLEQVAEQSQQLLKKTPTALAHALWGKKAFQQALRTPLLERMATQPAAVLDAEVGQLFKGTQAALQQQLEKPGFFQQLPQRAEALLNSAKAMTQELAAGQQQEPPLQDWPQYLHKELTKRGLLKGQTQPSHKDIGWFFKQELRLLSPIDDNFEEPAHLFNSKPLQALSHSIKTTFADIKEDAMPFFATGGVSIGSGVGAGLLANRLFNAPKEKNADVVKEGVFQFVANVCMCAIGAAGGMGAANLLGFSKFQAPLPRFLTIASGLGAGIIAGAQSANTISDRWVGPWVDKLYGVKQTSTAGRKINGQDMVLHLDDAPVALALSGLNVLKPWIPPFFEVSALKAARGYRNVAPEEHTTAQNQDKKTVSQAFPASNASQAAAYSRHALSEPVRQEQQSSEGATHTSQAFWPELPASRQPAKTVPEANPFFGTAIHAASQNAVPVVAYRTPGSALYSSSRPQWVTEQARLRTSLQPPALTG